MLRPTSHSSLLAARFLPALLAQTHTAECCWELMLTGWGSHEKGGLGLRTWDCTQDGCAKQRVTCLPKVLK